MWGWGGVSVCVCVCYLFVLILSGILSIQRYDAPVVLLFTTALVIVHEMVQLYRVQQTGQNWTSSWIEVTKFGAKSIKMAPICLCLGIAVRRRSQQNSQDHKKNPPGYRIIFSNPDQRDNKMKARCPGIGRTLKSATMCSVLLRAGNILPGSLILRIYWQF